nr:hypothetical protein [uncultured Duganella sp.]
MFGSASLVIELKILFTHVSFFCENGHEPTLNTMSIKEITASPTYNPNRVLDAIIEKLQLKNDAALSRALEVAPPVISKIRHNTLPIGATILIRMHEISDFSIRELREMMAA